MTVSSVKTNVINFLMMGALFLPSVGKAKEPEMYMTTDVGLVVLTAKPCHDKDLGKKFPYYAYATEVGEKNHEGCWSRDENTVLIYYPEINATAVYNPDLFKDKVNGLDRTY